MLIIELKSKIAFDGRKRARTQSRKELERGVRAAQIGALASVKD